MTNQAREDMTRAEFQQLVQKQLYNLLEQNNVEGVKLLLKPVEPVDVAEAIDGLPETMRAVAFRLLSKDESLEVYEYLEPNTQQALLETFKRQEVVDIFGRMSPDDRVRLMDELPAKLVRILIEQLSAEERQITSLLLGYPPETAGRMMTPRYVAIREATTAAETIQQVRNFASISETIYYLYVIDVSRHLKGVLSLRELVLAQPDQVIGDIMKPEMISVSTDTDQEEVARVIQRYDLTALPVVDREQRLVGIITVDDVLDVLEEETTEDIYTLGGLQTGKESYFQTNLFTIARQRVVWLLILLVANTFTGTIMHTQEDVLKSVVALSFFIPLLIGAGGNIGAQSSTVVIRGLSTEEISLRSGLRVISRELAAGSMLGGMLAVITIIWAYVLQGDLGVAIVVGVSLIAISMLASFAGSALPFLFNFLKRDPALMSAPFITTLVDVLGVFIYFMVARVVLSDRLLPL
ncbi:MAG: magnesium transporter [Synechococcales cyanobacterium K44_A2020_017]|nr:magnesium transporter [Synechococcales cyanobacterium K32_A2020_035]MBF2093707.1 magnesium transporter [Synechococcales cyanobacterium K44_A2020_017]